ncbi:4Fe-4S binding protein [Candidatus Karelsulcia muelleri]
MGLKITNECIKCGACELECPNKAIYEDESSYLIVSEKCTECIGKYEKPQCVGVCPMTCINKINNEKN